MIQRVIEGSDFWEGAFNFAVEDLRMDIALTLYVQWRRL